MSRRRFFVPEIRRGIAELTGSDAEHLVRVLRAEAGQVYEISDNHDLYLAEIEVARKAVVSFKILERLPAPASTVQVVLFAALIKFDRFEWLIEKATEAGAAEIQPFEAMRTERGLAQAAAKRRARWEKIALESSQQARRVRLPQIHDPIGLEKVLAANASLRLMLDEEPAAVPVLRALPRPFTDADGVALLLGPEGGWTEVERGQALAAGWQACSLGPTILRAETAALAGLAIIQAAWAARST
jgi:16S rRNA (uracil1498-N3)-methyltransferase